MLKNYKKENVEIKELFLDKLYLSDYFGMEFTAC